MRSRSKDVNLLNEELPHLHHRARSFALLEDDARV